MEILAVVGSDLDVVGPFHSEDGKVESFGSVELIFPDVAKIIG